VRHRKHCLDLEQFGTSVRHSVMRIGNSDGHFRLSLRQLNCFVLELLLLLVLLITALGVIHLSLTHIVRIILFLLRFEKQGHAGRVGT